MKVRTSSRSHNVVLEMGPSDSALPPGAVAELQLKRILAPVDFSECSHKAFQYAVHFAHQFNAELMLLHVVVNVPPPPQMLVFQSEELRGKYQEETARELANWRRGIVPALSVKAVTRVGTSAHQEIVDAARESNCDLIIIGHHGRTGLSRLLIGGTAERVVRYAPCPVLVIRDREHDFVRQAATESATSQSAATA